jgi:hypothetical protein
MSSCSQKRTHNPFTPCFQNKATSGDDKKYCYNVTLILKTVTNSLHVEAIRDAFLLLVHHLLLCLLEICMGHLGSQKTTYQYKEHDTSHDYTLGARQAVSNFLFNKIIFSKLESTHRIAQQIIMSVSCHWQLFEIRSHNNH